MVRFKNDISNLVQTEYPNVYLRECGSQYPEQYEVYIHDYIYGEEPVLFGYIRNRSGKWRAEYYPSGIYELGYVVAKGLSHGDGQFTAEERDHYLAAAVFAVYSEWIEEECI